jgi:hypothetical protein
MTLFFQLWGISAALILISHILPALVIDKRLALGTWDKMALTFFMLMGPLGLILEFILLGQVFRDIYQQARNRAPR